MLLQPAWGAAAGRQRLDSAGTAGDSLGGRVAVTPEPRQPGFPMPEARAAPERCLPV